MRDANALTLEMLAAEIANESLHAAESSAIPDDRLKLLFVCAHPAIDADMRTPLMLQTVLGLDAAQIGRVVPGRTGCDEPAPRASEEQDPSRRHFFRSARSAGAARAAGSRAERHLRRIWEWP